MKFKKSKHPLYSTYHQIIHRCYNPVYKQYKNYGARGIHVCEEFKNSFTAFVNYVESLPNYENKTKDHLTLDRINNDGNYVHGNLRWANKSTQIINQRPRKCYARDPEFVRSVDSMLLKGMRTTDIASILNVSQSVVSAARTHKKFKRRIKC